MAKNKNKVETFDGKYPKEIEAAHATSLKLNTKRKNDVQKGSHFQQEFDIDVKASYEASLKFAQSDEDKEHMMAVLTAGPGRFDR